MAILTYKFDDQTQLSPHFNAREFRCQCGQPHETLIASELIDKLEALYTALNCSKIIVTSGYRCPEHDKAVQRSAHKRHCCGCLLLRAGRAANQQQNGVLQGSRLRFWRYCQHHSSLPVHTSGCADRIPLVGRRGQRQWHSYR